ncbi:MAG: hypothetical protein L6R36_000071 [Xanthoria steineri]|nr:MAG: hypothetical protein L6R36_000071 [Xanthoria steineri]
MSDDKASPSPNSHEDSGFVPGDDFTAQWINYFRLVFGRMTDDGERQWKKARDLRNEATDCAKCEKHRDYLLNYSPIIRFMRQNINKLGGDLHSENIRCRRCDTRQSGGFEKSYGIILCANELRDQGHVEDTMAHEMIHAYDHLRFQVQWRDNLRHAACTEIRASALSGECRWFREFWTKGQYKVTQQFQECIRRRAVISVAKRPECKDDVQAAKVVNEVWDSCFSDTRPFDEVYR